MVLQLEQLQWPLPEVATAMLLPLHCATVDGAALQELAAAAVTDAPATERRTGEPPGIHSPVEREGYPN
jgi:hypothetical protein